jgi:hypothetical protein
VQAICTLLQSARIITTADFLIHHGQRLSQLQQCGLARWCIAQCWNLTS